ncbi:hypothetical protein BT93_L1033 [Corymbia citriodora subsp. variegata]|uniref:Mitochondrial zinc maintenance protein 1, mitochondrial n=1 Tax=Corymbia citriodora subsp. variegata TaxID=360336 RepID=A0A8T0CED2_CORYI|nr:hypothetical protein BT93_L1033 [Corymbia citriodora subsp. variegata]
MENTAISALRAYRHILRATRIAFRDDHHLMHAARIQARTGFNHASNIDPSTPEAQSAVAHAEEVAKILVENIVQGKRIEGEENKYRLNIHESTERGFNDTVKNPLKGGTVGVFQKCS